MKLQLMLGSLSGCKATRHVVEVSEEPLSVEDVVLRFRYAASDAMHELLETLEMLSHSNQPKKGLYTDLYSLNNVMTRIARATEGTQKAFKADLLMSEALMSPFTHIFEL